MLGIKLDGKKDISLKEKFNTFDNPKIVKIPLIQGKISYEAILKKDDSVSIGSIIGKCIKYDLPLFSSVSGKIKNIDNNFITIENDGEYSLDYRVEKNNIANKNDFISLIRNKGIVGLSGSMYPTYLKYNNSQFDVLIVNGVECEPYNTADYTVMVNYFDNIISVLELMINLFDIKECFIAIKGKNKYLKEMIRTKLSDNERIKIVLIPDFYPMGWSRNLVRYIKHTDYDKHTIEKGIIINNVSTIYSIYEAIFLNKPLIDRVVTFTGDALNKPCNIRVRFGTSIKDVIEYIGGYKKQSAVIISSGPMMGYNLENDEGVITSSLTSFIALSHSNDEKTLKCLRCGKCIENCPAKIYPVLVKDNINNIDELKRLSVNKCIGCGICSYVCPAKINLREYVEKARSELNEIRKSK